MGGGKETPRQKMVGMMYLVLTALLALNVTKAVLDAFVAIEDNIQKACVTQLQRGDSFISDLKEAQMDKSNPGKVAKVKAILKIVDQIDKETAARIAFIDEVKMTILTKSGEKVSEVKPNDKEAILWKPYSNKDPLRPARLNLIAVEAKDDYDVPMHEIIGDELTNITGSGKQLWSQYNSFRKAICSLVGSYTDGERNWSFKPIEINSFKDIDDLDKQVEKMLSENKINVQEDKEVLKQIYMELTKNERYDTEEEKNIHWAGKTFDHSPIVAAIASLSSMQQEILSARATALAHLKAKVSTGDFSFNKVMPLAYGPLFATEGDDIELKVMMAAYDSDNNPIVKLEQGTGDIEIGNGQGIIRTKASGKNELLFNGSVGIRRKTGSIVSQPWSHTVKIIKPQGTLSLPHLNVLYRNYPNPLECTVSGYDEAILTADNGASLTKVGGAYVIKPSNSSRTCTVYIKGKNSITNKMVALGQVEYKVLPLPKPQVYLGNIESGSKVSSITLRQLNQLFVKYDESVPLNIPYQVKSWTISFPGTPLKDKDGKGNNISNVTNSEFKQLKKGNTVIINVEYEGAGMIRQGVFTLTVE
jgi:gliding motility-associated protein GldM